MRHDDLPIGALNSTLKGSSESHKGHCIVITGKRLILWSDSDYLSLFSTQEYKQVGKIEETLSGNLRWTNFPNTGNRNIPSRCILTAISICLSTYFSQSRMQLNLATKNKKFGPSKLHQTNLTINVSLK